MHFIIQNVQVLFFNVILYIFLSHCYFILCRIKNLTITEHSKYSEADDHTL